MNKTTQLISCGILVLVTAGCGGSSTSPVAAAGPTFEEISEAGEQLFEDYQTDLVLVNYADFADLPDAGSADYAGYAAYVIDEDTELSGTAILAAPDFVSEMDLAVDFGEDAITGSIHTIFDVATETQVPGSATIEAAIDRDADLNVDYGVTGLLTGQMTVDGGPVALSANVEADFFREGDALFGFVTGSATDNQGSVGVQGTFLTERQ